MTEQERPRLDRGEAVREGVQRAYTAGLAEGRQQAVRRIRARIQRTAYSDGTPVWEYASRVDSILDEVAGLNDDESRYDDEPFKAWIGTADEMRHDR